MLDGVRWQEVFTGADSLLIHSGHGGIDDTLAAQRRFWRRNAEERRHALMPFIWDSIARKGQILGDAAHGSVARVTNGLNFSYPGYNEVLTGRGDPRINTNDYPPNPNVTVFEWLAPRPGSGQGGSVRYVGRLSPDLQPRAREHPPVGRMGGAVSRGQRLDAPGC